MAAKYLVFQAFYITSINVGFLQQFAGRLQLARKVGTVHTGWAVYNHYKNR